MEGRPPRNVRNNNPGNLERSSIEWLGLATLPEMNSEQRAEQRFCVFRAPAFGFRALAIDLFNSWKRGRMTVTQIISRFAPSNENDTDAYIDAVCTALNVLPDEPLHLDNDAQLTALAKAIATHESGAWLFNDADLAHGVYLARTPIATRLIA